MGKNTKKFFAYQGEAERVAAAAAKMPFIADTAVMINSGGVIRNRINHEPDGNGLIGMAMILPVLGETAVASGRYANTDMRMVAPAMEAAGINISNLTFIAEMGSIVSTMRPTENGMILSDNAEEIGCVPIPDYQWVVRFFAPPLSTTKHRAIMYVFERTLEQAMRAGALEDLGIERDADPREWTEALVVLETKNKTKASISANTEAFDLAVEVLTRLQGALQANLEEYLISLATPQELDFEVISQRDCVEIRYKGVNRRSMTERFLKKAQEGYFLSVGDRPEDLETAAVANENGRFSIYVHVGDSSEVDEYVESSLVDGKAVPDVLAVFPEKDARVHASPGHGSSTSFGEFLFALAEAIQDPIPSQDWEELLMKAGATLIVVD